MKDKNIEELIRLYHSGEFNIEDVLAVEEEAEAEE